MGRRDTNTIAEIKLRRLGLVARFITDKMTKALRHRHSPSLVTALLTLGAIAFGAMAQTLLRAVPSQSDHALIDALIAQPSGTRLGRFNQKVVDPQKPPLSDSTRKEQLTSATTTDLPEKETSSALNMEIRVALLGQNI